MVCRDLRLALRSLRRAPGFTIAAVLILALGISLATAMLAVMDGVLLRRLPVRDQDRVVVLRAVGRGAATELPVNLAELRRLQGSAQLQAVAGMAHYGVFPWPVSDGERFLALRQARVTGNFFQLLGSRPALGRLLRPEDDIAGANAVMVISYDLWRRRFRGDPGVRGRRLVIRGFDRATTIVGVAPRGLDFPVGADYWVPIVPTQYPFVDVVARLVPGASPPVARAAYLARLRQDAAAYPLDVTAAPLAVDLRTLPREVMGDVRPALMTLGAAVLLLLLLASLNVGNLLLLQATRRARELAIRRALGAAAGDLVRQPLAEAALLGLAGGLGGLLLARALIAATVALAPPELPRLDMLRYGGVPVWIALALTVAATAVFALAAALAAGRGAPAASLRTDTRAGVESLARRRLRRMLVAAQLAIALVVLAGAGVLARSLARLQGLNLGYRTDGLSFVELTLPFRSYTSQPKVFRLTGDLLAGFRAVPGVVAATPILVPPFLGTNVWNAHFDVEGRPPAQDDRAPFLSIESVGPDFPRALGLPIAHGRDFTDADRDGAPPVAIVTEAVARLNWPGADPIGKRIRMVSPDSATAVWRAVVGVTRDIHFRALREATPTVFLPYRQFFTQGVFALRTRGPLATVLPGLRRAVERADPDVAIYRADTMDEVLAGPLALPRLDALLLAAFALAALLIGGVGLYGVMAAAVAQRTHELGVRLAVGATPGRVRRLVLADALRVTAAGGAVGLLSALATTRLLRTLLFQVSPTDPLALAGAAVLLLGLGLLAAYLPARRATRVDPVEALRAE